VRVAEGLHAHVCDLNGALACAVDKRMALGRVKLRRRDHLRELFHVGRLHVHNLCGVAKAPKETIIF
jgi:hypothetical protein